MKRNVSSFLLFRLAIPAAIVAAATLGAFACSSSNPPPAPATGDAGTDAHVDDASTDHAAPPPGDASDASDASPDSGDSGKPVEPDGGEAGVADCGAIAYLAPLVTVENAAGGSIPCTATFALLESDGGTAPDDLGATLCGSAGTIGICPEGPDAGGTACTYALSALVAPSAVNVQASQTGFQPGQVAVVSGHGGCAGDPRPDPIVTLEPVDAH